MPKIDGVEACREIMESLPTTRVIMLTASTEEDAMIEALAAGATGYLQKVSGMDQPPEPRCKLAAAGEMHMPTEIVRRAFARLRSGRQPPEVALLTAREREIVAAFAQGMSYTAIAGGQGRQAGDHQKRHLRHPAQAWCRLETRDRGLGRAERPPRQHCFRRVRADRRALVWSPPVRHRHQRNQRRRVTTVRPRLLAELTFGSSVVTRCWCSGGTYGASWRHERCPRWSTPRCRLSGRP